MKKSTWILAAGVAACAIGSMICLAQNGQADTSAQDQPVAQKKILVYTQSFGFRHSVVARPLTGELSHAEKILKEILPKAGYEVFVSQDFNDLNRDQFKNYDAIIFYTTGDPRINRDNFMKWIKDGGALIGVHSATDTFKEWEDYYKLVGGTFKTHGGNQMDVTIVSDDAKHPSTRMLPKAWRINDEIYQMNNFSKDNVKMLLHIDTKNMTDEELKHHKMDRNGYYPVAYTNTLGKGRMFYTSLGHREDVWTDATFQEHLLGGIAWAMKLAE